MKPNFRKPSTGFTLIELLLSMVITTIIISILVTVTVVSLDIWNRSRSELRASNQAKAMIEAMSADFESMVVRRGNDFQWLFAEFSPPDDGPNDHLSPNALNLIFFSAATDRYNGQIGEDADLGGDISNIGYQLIYKDPISDQDVDSYKTFVLYRKIIDPKPTFENTLGRVDLKTAFETFTGNPATAVGSVENFVCENVYQFTVKFHVDIVNAFHMEGHVIVLIVHKMFCTSKVPTLPLSSGCFYRSQVLFPVLTACFRPIESLACVTNQFWILSKIIRYIWYDIMQTVRSINHVGT